MDSVEVAVRFTEAIMANSGSGRKATDPVEAYAAMFSQMLTRISAILDPLPPPIPPARPYQATSAVFPLTHDR